MNICTDLTERRKLFEPARPFSALPAGAGGEGAGGIPPGQSAAAWREPHRVVTVERARPMNTCRSGRCMTMRAVSLTVERPALLLVSASSRGRVLIVLRR